MAAGCGRLAGNCRVGVVDSLRLPRYIVGMVESTETTFAERVRAARTARAWTQERLAETVGLSSRTVQRIEGGEEPSLETQRLLAEALGIDLVAASPGPTSPRRIFGAPWDTLVKWVTGSMVVTFMAMIFLPIGTAAVVVWFILLAILLAMLPFYIGGYQITDDEVRVLRLGWASRFPLADLVGVEHLPHATAGSLRVLGIGGFMGYIGWFQNSVLGKYRMLATNQKDTVVLRFNAVTLVVSPDNPIAFTRAVEDATAGLNATAQSGA
jgi:DNA-binding XRE family transcriptional regulator